MQSAARLARVEATLPVSPSASPERFYRPELDALRFFAFLAVFLHHALLMPPFGDLVARYAVLRIAAQAGAFGVPLFFVLSSYLITELLLREHERTETVDVKAFYARRILRIWPLYYAVLSIAILQQLVAGSPIWDWTHCVALLMFLGNWTVGSTPMALHFTVPLWSVCVEEQFYLVWPLVVRRVTGQRILRLAVGLVVLGTLSRVGLAAAGAPGMLVGTSTLSHLDSIGIGAALAVMLRREDTDVQSALVVRTAAIALGVLGLLTMEYINTLAPPFFLPQLGFTAVPLFCALILRACLHPTGFLAKLLWSPVLTYLGKISYGLYVTHLLVLLLARGYVSRFLPLTGAAGLVVYLALSLGATVALAALSYRFLERPFLRQKERFSKVLSRPV